METYRFDEKRKLRKAKRELKREGNKNRRRALKKALNDHPNEVEFDDDYEFKYDSSERYNEPSKDSKRKREDDTVL